MPRRPRKSSNIGMYHVMLRGINQQMIFEDDRDKQYMLDTIKRFQSVSNVAIHSYCLMDNHIHLLVKERDESISRYIQRVSSSFVYWYNHKYERIGHLFQDRFRSESIETMSSFLRVLRYIHQNPVKAGIATNVLAYKWSSIHAYVDASRSSSFIDYEPGLQLFSPDRSKACQAFSDYMQLENDDVFLDDTITASKSDLEIRDHLSRLGIAEDGVLQQMNKEHRNAILLDLKEQKGISIRQLARITGISKSVIDRVI